jgi:hypothetical protein
MNIPASDFVMTFAPCVPPQHLAVALNFTWWRRRDCDVAPARIAT